MIQKDEIINNAKRLGRLEGLARTLALVEDDHRQANRYHAEFLDTMKDLDKEMRNEVFKAYEAEYAKARREQL